MKGEYAYIMTNKRLEADIRENNFIDEEDYEQLAGFNCPCCGYPIVIEMGLEVCYRCGWSKEDEAAGYCDE